MSFLATKFKQIPRSNNSSQQFKNLRNKNKESQMQQLLGKNSISVAIVENKAYWVHNNTVYRADIDTLGEIDTDNAKPIDVFSLSKKETKELLKILDSLSEK
jgi:uncharacterized protein YaiL (DUF2058 family)